MPGPGTSFPHSPISCIRAAGKPGHQSHSRVIWDCPRTAPMCSARMAPPFAPSPREQRQGERAGGSTASFPPQKEPLQDPAAITSLVPPEGEAVTCKSQRTNLASQKALRN